MFDLSQAHQLSANKGVDANSFSGFAQPIQSSTSNLLDSIRSKNELQRKKVAEMEYVNALNTSKNPMLNGLSSNNTNLIVPTPVTSPTGNPSSNKLSALLNQIAIGEGTDDAKAQKFGIDTGYDVSLGYGKYVPKGSKNISGMTLGEIKALQKQIVKNGGSSSAVGKYQFIGPTLKQVQTEMKLPDSTVFNPQTQDDMIIHRLNKTRGLQKWLAGNKSDKDFQKSLSQEFASIVDPNTNKSYYGQHVGNTTADMLNAFNKVRSYK